MNKNISAPISDEDAKGLRAGDYVYITGTIYTARDAAHKRMSEALAAGKTLPIDMKNNIIYYMGPSPAREGRPIGSAGPTTASRMDKYAPSLLDLGLKGMIGKGKRTQQVKDAIVRNGAVYFAAVGGAGALLSQRIKKSEVIAYEDLGTEAIRKLEVEDFPVIVVIDSKGNNLYETAIKEYAAKLFPKNSVLVVGIGATLGKVGISLNECSSNQQINAIIFNSTVLPEYGAYYLLAGKEYIKSQSNAATLPILNQSTMGELQIVVPNIEEQKNIVGFINKKVSVIKEGIENLQIQISDLKSYKSSLITEAVTGKIDLRDWQTKKS